MAKTRTLSLVEKNYLEEHREDSPAELARALSLTEEMVVAHLEALPAPGGRKAYLSEKGAVAYTESQSMADDGDGISSGQAQKGGRGDVITARYSKDIETWIPRQPRQR